MQKSREGLIGLERGAVTGGIEGGYKAADQAGQSQRTALTAGANVFGTETQSKDNAARIEAQAKENAAMREVERLKIGAQNAATAAQRDANDFAKLSGHLSTITNNRARAEQAVIKSFQKDAQAIEMALMANPKDKEALNRKAMLQLEIDAAVDKTTKPFDTLASSIQAKLYGGGQGGLGGFTVREKPTK
jgi:N-acetylmuramoyl-L-alanine amidase